MKNVELKARLASIPEAERVCDEIGAEFEWRRRQRDIYFEVAPPNRLKLRIEDNESPYLILYKRPMEKGSRECTYRKLYVRDTCHDECASFFTDALKVLVEVDKSRELFMWENVRIHLDEVAGLGLFIEFEHPIGKHGIDEARARLAYLSRAFGLAEDSTVEGSYSDLLMQRS